VLVLLDSPQLPRRAHLLSGPFLDAILSQKRLPGLEVERRLGPTGGSGLGSSLAEGFALYCPPLSDPLPRPAANLRPTREGTRGGTPPYEDTPGESPPADEGLPGEDTLGEAAPGEAATEAPPMFLQAQRFARGWMIANPPETGG
jgi:hypothetical protein